MINNEAALLQYLKEAQISFDYSAHPPVYTCDEAHDLRPTLDGVSTKNLFLQDSRTHNYYLLMCACEKRMNIKQIGQQIGAPKLHFASAEKMIEFLGVSPGSVTVLALINDPNQVVTLLVDAEIWHDAHFLCHPLVNTATVRLARADLLHFLELSNHIPQIIEISAH